MKVAFTFDDGPGIHTKALLKGLKQRNIKATFFVVGENVIKNKKLLKLISKDGHEVGNHTFSHQKFSDVDYNQYIDSISQNNILIEKIIKKKPKFYRPPYGDLDKRVDDETQMTHVLWNVCAFDWENKSSKEIKEIVFSQLKEENVILLHETYNETVKAVFDIIDDLKSKGCEFVTLEEISKECYDSL